MRLEKLFDQIIFPFPKFYNKNEKLNVMDLMINLSNFFNNIYKLFS